MFDEHLVLQGAGCRVQGARCKVQGAMGNNPNSSRHMF
jgi:hypothetical protein